MKQVNILLILLIMTALPALGQKNMHIRQLFESDYKHKHDVMEVIVEGKKLKPYNLTLFKSITLANRSEEISVMERLVREDAVNAKDKSVALIGGRLLYGFYRFEDPDKNRFIFYRNQSLRKGGKNEATLVYMEGYASLAEIQEMFK